MGAGPHGLRPSPDGKLLVVANVAGITLTFIDTTSNTRVADVEVGEAPAQVAFSPDGERAVTASNDHSARIWDAVTGKQLAVLAHDGLVRGAMFSPDGQNPGNRSAIADTSDNEYYVLLYPVPTPSKSLAPFPSTPIFPWLCYSGYPWSVAWFLPSQVDVDSSCCAALGSLQRLPHSGRSSVLREGFPCEPGSANIGSMPSGC